MESERDELAAHVERLQEAFRKDYANMNWTWVKEVLDEASTTSLARLKREWQAEVLEESAKGFEFHERARQVLNWEAKKLRQQAEDQQ